MFSLCFQLTVVLWFFIHEHCTKCDNLLEKDFMEGALGLLCSTQNLCVVHCIPVRKVYYCVFIFPPQSVTTNNKYQFSEMWYFAPLVWVIEKNRDLFGRKLGQS